MPTVARNQTIIRLDPELLSRVKAAAKLEKLSFNAFVEGVLERETAIDKIPGLDELAVSEEVLSLRAPAGMPVDGDAKFLYLKEKYSL